MIPPNTALIIIDVQKGLDDPQYGIRNNPAAEQNMQRILHAWRQAKRPIIHIQHHSKNPNSKLRPELPGCAIKEEVLPLKGEPIFRKHTHSAFVSTVLDDYLRKSQINSLVLMGLTIEHCVSSTARSADDLGYRVYVVSDATAAYGVEDHTGAFIDPEHMYAASLASLHQEFAQIVDTDSVLGFLSKT